MIELDKRIGEIFNILIQFEKIFMVEDFDDEARYLAELSYKNYLDRLSVFYAGIGNQDILNYIKGLYKEGANANHDTVKRTVFHIINILKRG